MSISVEYLARVYDDDNGTFTEIGPDGDGLGLCRIAFYEDGQVSKEINFSWEEAEAMAKTIFLLARKNKPSS